MKTRLGLVFEKMKDDTKGKKEQDDMDDEDDMNDEPEKDDQEDQEDDELDDEKKKDKKNEKLDVPKVIADLITTDFGTDNDSQGKAVQLMKGLAFSDDERSNKFMKALSDLMKKEMNPTDFE